MCCCCVGLSPWLSHQCVLASKTDVELQFNEQDTVDKEVRPVGTPSCQMGCRGTVARFFWRLFFFAYDLGSYTLSYMCVCCFARFLRVVPW